MRVGYLGPPGTYTHEALRAGGAAGEAREEVPLPTIHDVVRAVQDGEVARGVVPIENSVEGSVDATLDALAFGARDVVIVAETVRSIHHCLIVPPGLTREAIRVVASHPQALAQCAGYLRERLPGVEVRAETSTAAAVRAALEPPTDAGGGAGAGLAALGPRSAATRYGGEILEADVEDVAGNVTRFAWLARREAAPGRDRGDVRPYRTAVAFWPRESDAPGWLVDTLGELARRGINLTRIESRPRRVGLGEYVFFVDLTGHPDDPALAAGLEGVRDRVSELRVLGAFPAA